MSEPIGMNPGIAPLWFRTKGVWSSFKRALSKKRTRTGLASRSGPRKA